MQAGSEGDHRFRTSRRQAAGSSTRSRTVRRSHDSARDLFRAGFRAADQLCARFIALLAASPLNSVPLNRHRSSQPCSLVGLFFSSPSPGFLLRPRKSSSSPGPGGRRRRRSCILALFAESASTLEQLSSSSSPQPQLSLYLPPRVLARTVVCA